MYRHDDLTRWSWLLMGFGMAAFWAAVVWTFPVVMRRDAAGRKRTTEQVLAARFARGEIDEREYRERLRTLRSVGAPSRMAARETRSEAAVRPQGSTRGATDDRGRRRGPA